jgi:hypothetical protein
MLESLLNKYGISVEHVLGIDFISLVNASKASSLEDLKALLISFAVKASEHLSSMKKDDPKRVLDNIKSYIDEHYFEPKFHVVLRKPLKIDIFAEPTKNSSSYSYILTLFTPLPQHI